MEHEEFVDLRRQVDEIENQVRDVTASQLPKYIILTVAQNLNGFENFVSVSAGSAQAARQPGGQHGDDGQSVRWRQSHVCEPVQASESPNKHQVPLRRRLV